MTEDEMVGWHHWLNGHGFGWTWGVGDGQGGLAGCGSWGFKELDTTVRLNWTDSKKIHLRISLMYVIFKFFWTVPCQNPYNIFKQLICFDLRATHSFFPVMLLHSFKKFSPWTNWVSITWELVWNVDSLDPQTDWIKRSGDGAFWDSDTSSNFVNYCSSKLWHFTILCIFWPLLQYGKVLCLFSE